MKKGLTLVEVIITIVISGIFFTIIGIISYNISNFERKGKTKIDLQGLIRYAELHIKTELRKSSTFYIENPQTIKYFYPDSNIARQISAEGQQLVLKVANETKAVLLEKVDYIKFQQVGISSDAIKVELSTSKSGVSEIFFSSTTFFIKIRNKFVGL